MMYAASKDAIKRALEGIADDYQCNDEDDIELRTILGKVSKGAAKLD
jgi:hypothetical protein